MLTFVLMAFAVVSVFAEDFVRGDCDHDGNVTISDVTSLIDYLLTGDWPDDPISPVIETYTVNGVTFEMVLVDGGTFLMGCDSDDWDFDSPAHEVTLDSYRIGVTEVTQELWQAVMEWNPSYFSPIYTSYPENLQRPVEYVSWDDCQVFLAKLNELTGLNFRLPSEAEWEFAARGGNASLGYKYSGSNIADNVAWYLDNSPSSGSINYGTQTVATKQPNELGIYDMSGNVLEWCQDWMGDYSEEPQINPIGPDSGGARVVRGGCFEYYENDMSVTWRGSLPNFLFVNSLGLRLAL